MTRPPAAERPRVPAEGAGTHPGSPKLVRELHGNRFVVRQSFVAVRVEEVAA